MPELSPHAQTLLGWAREAGTKGILVAGSEDRAAVGELVEAGLVVARDTYTPAYQGRIYATKEATPHA